MSVSRQLAALLKVPFAVFMVFSLTFGAAMAEQTGDIEGTPNQQTGEVTTSGEGEISTPEGEDNSNPPGGNGDEVNTPPVDNDDPPPPPAEDENNGEGDTGEEGSGDTPAADEGDGNTPPGDEVDGDTPPSGEGDSGDGDNAGNGDTGDNNADEASTPDTSGDEDVDGVDDGTDGSMTQSNNAGMQPLQVDGLEITLNPADGETVTLPAETMWAVTQGETSVADGSFTEATELTATIQITDTIDYGDYVLALNAPGFEPLSVEFAVSEEVQSPSVEVSLTPTEEPSQSGTANITVDKDYDDNEATLAEGSIWSIVNTDTTEEVRTGELSGELPLNFNVADLLYGNYTLSVDAAGHEFQEGSSVDFIVDGEAVSVDLELTLTTPGRFWPPHSTNDSNRDNGRAHVVQVPSETCGTVTLQFNNETQNIAYFEVLADGEQMGSVSGNVGSDHQVVPGDVQHAGYNVVHPDHPPLENDRYEHGFTETYEASEVQVRFALGSPGSDYFGWTSFSSTSEPCTPEDWEAPSTNDANSESGQAHVVQLESETCGEVTLQFNNETQYIAYFEVLADGEQMGSVSDNVGNDHQIVPGDVQYAGYNVVHPTNYTGQPLQNDRYDHGLTVTYEASEVQVRFALGTPNSAYFNWTSFHAEPCPVVEDVSVTVASADPDVANTLPADASWTVSQDGVELESDTFAAEHLELPAVITVNNPVPPGTYDVAVNAGPTFEPYTGQLVVSEESSTFNIELQPVVDEEEPTPTETVTPEPTEPATPEPTDPVTPEPTDPVAPGEQTLVIRVELPDGASIEGAPWSLFAPLAAQQFMAEPFATGFVGPDNTIQIDGLVPGDYRLVIEPEGMAPIDVLVAVGTDPTTEAAIIVDENGEASVVYAGQEPPATEPATETPATEEPSETSPVTGLPETGQGTANPAGALLMAASLGAVLLGAGAFAIRRSRA